MSLAARSAVVFALGVAAWAQQPAAHQVSLDVNVTDANGRFVSGLHADQFRITDDGKPQKIVSFKLVNTQGAAAPTIVLFDLFNANLTERGNGEQEVVKAIGDLGPAAANVYLYLLTPTAKLYAVHAIPEGGAQRPDPNWPGNLKATIDEAFQKVYGLKPLTDLIPIYRARSTWIALEDLATAMSAIPGRKNFVWITQGVPTGYILPPNELIDNPMPLRVFAERLSAMDAVAYTVQQRLNEGIPSEGEGSEWDTLRHLTEITGGRTFPTDATVMAVNQAIADSREYYRIVYDSPDQSWNGKYHKVKVTGPSKDLRIHTIQGYYALPPAPGI